MRGVLAGTSLEMAAAWGVSVRYALDRLLRVVLRRPGAARDAAGRSGRRVAAASASGATELLGCSRRVRRLGSNAFGHALCLLGLSLALLRPHVHMRYELGV